MFPNGIIELSRFFFGFTDDDILDLPSVFAF